MMELTQPPAEAGFEAFFGPAFARAKALAASLGLDAFEAEDVALEALTRAYVRWSRLSGLAWREAWVLKVTTNLTIDVFRRRRPSPGPVPVASAFETATVERLDLVRGLRRLSRRQRQVAVLSYVADLPDGQVAAALHLREGTVKTHAHRARQALRPMLDDPAAEARDV